MFVAYYLWSNLEEAALLLPLTIGFVAVYALSHFFYRAGRSWRAFRRMLVGLVFADGMTEFGWYLAYMEFFPGYEAAEAFRLMPGFVLCPLFFLGSWWMVKILNQMLQ